MLDLWRSAVLSPNPTSDDTSFRKWVKDPKRRIRVTSPTGTRSKILMGYKNGGKKSAVVLGHRPSAGSHFNSTGHMQPRSHNVTHNMSTSAYHGLEDSTWSAQSGSSEPRYESPRPDRGSHPSYYDSTRPDFTGGPWRTYTPVPPPKVIDYIERKLNAVATTAATDPDYISAADQFAKLKSTYSTSAAMELLTMIKKKGWR